MLLHTIFVLEAFAFIAFTIYVELLEDGGYSYYSKSTRK